MAKPKWYDWLVGLALAGALIAELRYSSQVSKFVLGVLIATTIILARIRLRKDPNGEKCRQIKKRNNHYR